MTPRIAPRVDDWPVAQRYAALRSGTLVRCGDGFRPVTWPDSPATRCASIGGLLTAQVGASGETAAWVWGALRDPPRTQEVVMRNNKVGRAGHSVGTRYHQYRMRPEDLVEFGPYAVTSRFRTAYDLLRERVSLTRERQVACRLLLANASSPVDQLADRFASASHADRGQVLRALAEIYGLDLACAVRDASGIRS